MFFYTNFLALSKTKNNVYCFDQFTHTFKVCEIGEFKERSNGGINNILYLTKEHDKDPMVEINKINAKYRHFFIQDSIYYLSKNYNSIDKFKNPRFYYQTVIIITKNEGYNIFVEIRLIHDIYNYLLLFMFFIFLGNMMSNLIGSFFVDVSIIILNYDLFICIFLGTWKTKNDLN